MKENWEAISFTFQAPPYSENERAVLPNAPLDPSCALAFLSVFGLVSVTRGVLGARCWFHLIKKLVCLLLEGVF